MYRCQFISSAVGGLAATGIAESTAASTSGTTRYRAAVIGHTGLGNYGHQWNVACNPLDSIDMVAVADPDEEGRAAATAQRRR